MSDEEYSDYDIDGNGEDEQDINKTFTEEERNKLYFDENEDEENEKWVTDNYKSSGKKSDAYLSCPCCFTLLCIESQRHSTYKNQYRAISVNNCIVDKNQNIVYNDKRDKNINNNKNSSNNNNNRSRKNNGKNRYSNRRKQQQIQQQHKQKKNQGIRSKLENTHLDEKEEKEDTDTYENTDDTDSEEEQEEIKESTDIGSSSGSGSGSGSGSSKDEDYSDSEDDDEVYQPVKCAVCDTHVAMFDKDEVYHFFNVFPS